MIRIVTLHDNKNIIANTKKLDKLINQLCLSEADVICFQGVQRTIDGKNDHIISISKSLNMAYSFSSTDMGNCSNVIGKNTVSGLAILAGNYVWMLNSGSFTISSENSKNKTILQFAVVRHNSDSVLIINTEYSSEESVHIEQIKGVFASQLLKESFDAVVFCCKGNFSISMSDLNNEINLSGYKLDSFSQAIDCDEEHLVMKKNHFCEQEMVKNSIVGAILTLIPKNKSHDSVKIHCYSVSHLIDSALKAEIEINKSSFNKKNLLLFPLSYHERLLGSNNRAMASSVAHHE